MNNTKPQCRLLHRVVWLVCLCVFFVGCGSQLQEDQSGQEAVTLIKVAFWGSPSEIGIITECINEWEKTHPNIKVRFEHTPYGGYVNKILTRIAGNAAPDVICTEVNYFVTFATKKVLHDLTPLIQKDQSFDINEFFPEVVDRFTYQNNLYAIPRDTAPFACVFYNKDIFDEAGVAYPTDDWTWEDLLAKAKALTITNEKGRIDRYGFYGWAWQNFVYGNGANLVDDVKNPTKCMLDDPLAIEGLQFYSDLINKHKVMPTPVALSNLGMGIDYMFSSGKLAMFLSGIWETPGLRNYDFNWDVAMFPQNKQGIRRVGTGGSGYCILKSSKHKKEAWEVIKALTSIQAQIKLSETGLAQPARIVISKENFTKHPGPPANKGMLNEAVKYAVYDPFSPKWREADARFITPAVELIGIGKKTAAECVKKIISDVNELLEQPDE